MVFAPDEDAEGTEHEIKGKGKDEAHSVVGPDIVLAFLGGIA